ncbi:hypothetical protein FNL55_16355 [Tardiphaga sp. vice352]|uniref:DedA family protein n=1 Tax=unclassified Tardiphaga TaxID=2631404 RepID=UPI00116357CF|nr:MULTISPECIES: VTT domain-containing protein [unclassified Tardiphaga]MBC7584689.1 VTT domain-containing protein [Tardiphaga sp.]QDM17347.1 hypothetical protein FNL53_16450 [Tardiphaga sp. vice278]QDM22320.1 hypothetical protein FIU28_15060 [Tardiphaga sp. vice154]QDM27605.1 hypothetical protein FNL56_16870 [Tardiphaga sp. vice304]QDM32746.1 hypothetical protein FNL55_16355 [Tardiphaga sp. vice352]
MNFAAAHLPDALVACIGAGPLGIGLIGLAEKLCPVVPSYLLFVVTGVVLAAGNGNPVLALLAAAVGSTAGSLCWYGAGRKLGETRSNALVSRFGPWIHLSPTRYQFAVNAFHRNLLTISTIGQTIPAMRVFLAVPAGAIGVSISRFLIGTFIGSVIWTAPLIIMGYFIGTSRADPASDALLLIVVLIALEVLAVTIWRRWRRRR